MLSLGGRRLSVDLLMPRLLRSPVPRRVPDRLARTPTSRRSTGTVAVVEIVVAAAGRVGPRLAGAVPAAARVVVAAAGTGGLPVLPAGPVAHAVVGGGHPVPAGLHLPVPRHLGAAPPAAGGQPMVGSAGGAGHVAGPAVPGAGRPRTPWCSGSWRWRSPRPAACAASCVALRGHLVVWVPLVAAAGRRTSWRAPGARADRPHVAGVLGRVGRARRATSSPATPFRGSSGGPWADPGPGTIVGPAGWAVALSWAVVVLLVVGDRCGVPGLRSGAGCCSSPTPWPTPCCSSAVAPVPTSARRWG